MQRPAKQTHHYAPHHLQHFHSASPKNRFLAVFLTAVILTSTVVFLRNGFSFTLPQPSTFTSIDWAHLLTVSSFTLTRLLISYLISLPLAIGAAVVVTANRRVEAVLLPVFDVLQSVPVLAFFPIAVLAFADIGLLEGAAILVLVLTMLFNIMFNLIVALHTVPSDIELAAKNYGATGWRYLWYILIPATFPALVTGSILAWGQAWNISIVAEYINFGAVQHYLPGLGSTLDQAASSSGQGNTTLFIVALLVLVVLVIALNRLVWQPLISVSERFKFE